jgi:hypothetical protein
VISKEIISQVKQQSLNTFDFGYFIKIEDNRTDKVHLQCLWRFKIISYLFFIIIKFD